MHPSLKRYSRYVSLMKFLLPFGISLSLGIAIGWPYFLSLGKEEKSISIDPSHPDIQESRMIRPHYVSTDQKGQPFHVNAEWAKQRTETLADLISPQGTITLLEGQTFHLKAQEGHYESNKKLLNLKGGVTVTSTDGYNIQTEEASISVDHKIIEGDDYIEGEGPTGKLKGTKGFKVESLPEGKILTLKGPSQVIINPSALKKKKADHVP